VHGGHFTVAGGIGIMDTLALVSVSERSQEIGTESRRRYQPPDFESLLIGRFPRLRYRRRRDWHSYFAINLDFATALYQLSTGYYFITMFK